MEIYARATQSRAIQLAPESGNTSHAGLRSERDALLHEASVHWHLFMWALHLLRPAWSYRLNAVFEDHAEHEYMRFVAQHPELDDEPFECVAAQGYGRFPSVADLLRQIGHDERVHKLESLAAQQSAGPGARSGDENEFTEAA